MRLSPKIPAMVLPSDPAVVSVLDHHNASWPEGAAGAMHSGESFAVEFTSGETVCIPISLFE